MDGRRFELEGLLHELRHTDEAAVEPLSWQIEQLAISPYASERVIGALCDEARSILELCRTSIA